MGISSTELKAMMYPQCGAPMSHGCIAGHRVRVRLRWTDSDHTKTIFAGMPLRPQHSWLIAPSVEALRCEACKPGVFRYDN
jgi:hypothetical protein